MRHRNPFRRTRRTGGRRVHVTLAREKHDLFTVLMPLHVRTQRLETVVHRHVQTVQPEQVLCRRRRQDTVEMVLLTIDSIARDGQDITQRLLRRVTRLAAPETQTQRLHTTDNHQHRVDEPGIRQRTSFVIQIGFDFSTHNIVLL